MCGEQADGHRLFADGCGSPPRVRGTVFSYQVMRLPPGITPACAGNRQAVENPSQGDQDHPRVCGEQLLPFAMGLYLLGSPPRVRGTVGDVDNVYGGVGITPACAGNSFSLRCGGIIWRDHPRVCGEQRYFPVL